MSRIEVHASADQAMRRWHDLVRERTTDGRERALAGDEMLDQKKALLMARLAGSFGVGQVIFTR